MLIKVLPGTIPVGEHVGTAAFGYSVAAPCVLVPANQFSQTYTNLTGLPLSFNEKSLTNSGSLHPTVYVVENVQSPTFTNFPEVPISFIEGSCGGLPPTIFMVENVQPPTFTNLPPVSFYQGPFNKCGSSTPTKHMVENVQPLTYKQDDCDEISARVSVIELQNHDPFEDLHSSDEHQRNIALVSSKPSEITQHSQED